MLITGKKDALRFQRHLRLQNGRWWLMSCLPSPSRNHVLTAGCDQTYVVMSRTFQRGQLQPWLYLTQSVRLSLRATDIKALFLSDTTYSLIFDETIHFYRGQPDHPVGNLLEN